jgi:hypothetical protein
VGTLFDRCSGSPIVGVLKTDSDEAAATHGSN